MKKVYLILTLIGLVIIGAIIYTKINAAPDSVLDMKTDFVLTAEKLLLDFEENENEANKKYLDKVIEIEGQVSKVDVDKGKTSVYLDAKNDLSNIIFQLNEENLNITKGDKIKLKGVCTGYLLDVILVRAKII